MIARFLGNLLSIKPNERDGVFYFFLVLLVFSFGASFARSIGMTLLVGEMGGETLPLMFVFIDLSVMAGSPIYAHYTKRASGLEILGFFLIATAVFSIIAQLLFILKDNWWLEQDWVYGLFFVGFFFFYILVNIHISSFVASYFTAVQVKRVTPIINAGFPIGGVLGGSTLLVFLSVFHIQPQNLVAILGASCIGSYWLLRVINARFSPIRVGSLLQSNASQSKSNPLSEIMVAFKYIVGSKLMIYMSLGLMLFVIASKVLEYHYQTIIYYEIFQDDTQRATFFATYEVFANLAWLFIQLFLTSRIIMKLGVGASNVLYPALAAIMSLALFIFFYQVEEPFSNSFAIMLVLGVFTQFVNQEMRGALRTPVNNLLFNAIPPNQWGVNKAFLNGIVFPISTVAVGVFLILITGDNNVTIIQSLFPKDELHYLLPLVALVVSILGILAALPQWAAYNKGVFGLLNRELFSRQTDVKLSGWSNNSLKQVIEQKLSSVDPYHVVAALEMIRVLRLSYFIGQVGDLLLKSQVFKIKEHCINTLAALPQSNVSVNYLVEALQTEKDADVLPLILKNLAKFQLIDFNDTIEKLLIHRNTKVFVEACLCLHKHPNYQHKDSIERRILSRLQRSQEPEDVALYLYALGELRHSYYSSKVLPFLEDTNNKIRLAAFTAFIRMLEGQLEPHKELLIKALNSSDKDMKIAALRALKECQSLDNWSPIIELLGARDRTLVAESKELLRLSLGTCKSALINHVFSDKISVQQRFEILSLIYSKLNPGQHKQLQQKADDSLKKFVQINGLLKLHESLGYTSKVHDLIAKVLQEIAEEHLQHVLTVITFASDQNIEFFQRVSRGVLSLSRANQGNALEVLSNAKEKYLVSRLLKYFDERATDMKSVARIYIALFGEKHNLNESNYESQLQILNNDMIDACLLYLVKEGQPVNLENSRTKVRDLMTEI
ncbi:hypothetical protein QUF74_09240 [Candidatus Halobeggiatoa sp. HSG11]|nr:hypothetical protein [Candidatus Halobeggiatoa sp. HSG11]